ncbi:MAG: hypothetical protein WC700_16080 [Gemmatimonadaceae bacterium]|jgi:hypothetical protein
MTLCRNVLRVFAFAAYGLVACSASTDSSVAPPGSTPQSHLSLRADFGPDLILGDIHMAAPDSLILRAAVVGNPADYGVPSITATDSTALEIRGDGTAAVRHIGELNLTAVALPKSPSARTPTLVAKTRLHLACTLELRAGIYLLLHDSATGQPPQGSGTMRLRATSGTFSDSVTAPLLMGAWGAAWERPGTYSVSAQVDGYQPWRRDNIEVTHGLCHVRAVTVLAKLQRP